MSGEAFGMGLSKQNEGASNKRCELNVLINQEKITFTESNGIFSFSFHSIDFYIPYN